MAYSVIFSKRAFKDLASIPDPYYSSIRQAIRGLAQNPRPAGCKKLIGRTSYRIRVGNYRVIYTIEDNQLIVNVIGVGHRKNVYQIR